MRKTLEDIETPRCRLSFVLLWLLVISGMGWANLPVRNFWGEDVIKSQGDRMLFNPALWGFVPQSRVAFNLGFRVLTEERTRFVYDQFENTIGEAVIADNISSGWLFGPVTASYLWRQMVLGIDVGPVRDFGYFYLKEFRDEFYVKMGEDRLVQDGVIYQGDVRMAFLPWEFLSLGARAGYLWGTRKLSVQTIRIPETTSYQVEERLKGIGWAVGAGWRLSRRLELGLGYIEKTGFARVDYLKGLPATGVMSLDYRAPGDLPSEVILIAGIDGWHGVDSTLSNIPFIRVQIEHLMLNFVRLRYGLSWEPLPADVKVNRGEATLGVGFDVGKWRLSVDGSFSREELSGGHFSLPVFPEDVRVYEKQFVLRTGMVYGF